MIDPSLINTGDELSRQLAEMFNRGGWSRHRLAEASGLSPATLQGILNASTKIPRTGTLTAFVKACGYDPGPWVEARHRALTAGSGQPRARNFFNHLITAHTELFAGRDKQSEQILQFTGTHRSGYVFIEGLSGYGKTSLLANLVARNPKFCYHFITQVYKRSGSRFDPTRATDIFENLWEQLNPGQTWTGDPQSMSMEFRRLLSEPRRTPAVLVIDAVDELEPPDQLWGFLPARLPAGIVIIISARSQGDRSPLQDLGLSMGQMGLHLRLPGLDDAAITALLALAGGLATPLAQDVEFVASLNEISRGDPFYLRFLIEDVACGVLTRANIDQTPSGLDSYLDLQLEMLERSAHRPQHVEILGFLLEAGVLSRADLMHMVEGLTWLNFDVILREIHRFLLVYDNQYSFCHDRFREYFKVKAGLGNEHEISS